MLLPFTKKEFKTFLIIVEFLAFVALLVGFIFATNEYKKLKVTPDMKNELEEWRRVSKATQKLVSEELWQSSQNEGRLLANTVEEGVRMSIYTQYQTTDGKFESIVTSGTISGQTDNKTVRETLTEKFSNAFATTSAATLLKEDEPVVIGAILNWERNGETYSLIDINGDGQWDYVAKGAEAHFTDEEGDLAYTNDVGEQTFVTAGSSSIEVFSPLTLSEAEKLFTS